MTDAKPTPTRLADYRPPDWLVDEIALDVDLDESATRVRAQLACRRNPAGVAADAALNLDGEEIELLSLRVDGRALEADEYHLDETALVLPGLADQVTVEIETRIDAAANSKLEGLYLSNGVFCTQCEAEGFRRITFFPDRPDVMAVYHVTMRADAARFPVLLCNGNPVACERLAGGRHSASWHDPFPKPSYLFALVAGDLARIEDHFTTASGREVALRIYVEHGQQGRAGYAMEALKRAMRWDEERYGLEYDLDLFNIVAVSDFNMGAMENKSLNIFNAKCILAEPETATDQDYAFIESVVAHEYFHNWTGNRVTCRDWFQLSLKEGLTVFRDQQFSADMRSAAVERIQDVRTLRARQFPEDAGPLAHPVRPSSYIEINNFYTATVYDKGAELIRMLHRLLGEDDFRAGMRLYFERHDGQAATCDDFLAAMAEAAGADLRQFGLWYAQAGTPTLTVTARHDAEAAELELEFRQETPPTPGQAEKLPLHLPFELGLLARDGRALPLRLEGEQGDASTSRVLELREATQRFRFHGIEAPPVLSLNRGFTAPVKLQHDLDETDRALLMAHDPDHFNRFEAAQQFATRLLLEGASALKEGASPPAAQRFIAALGRCLRDQALDAALRAEILGLPSEDYLAEQMAVIDVDAIHQTRQGLRRAIAERLKDQLMATYHGQQSNAPYGPDAASAGRRALRNRALSYLATLAEVEMAELPLRQYQRADNMTDSIAALALLNDVAGEARAAALEDFHRRHHENHLVLDKWFALQATSALPDTLERVHELTGHRAFSLANPNRVRALIGAFATQNPLRFHAADGAGYEFLADHVLDLDKRNPQLAARLLPPLGRWRRFAAPRRERMRAALERILARPRLSADVYEIASKSLA